MSLRGKSTEELREIARSLGETGNGIKRCLQWRINLARRLKREYHELHEIFQNNLLGEELLKQEIL